VVVTLVCLAFGLALAGAALPGQALRPPASGEVAAAAPLPEKTKKPKPKPSATPEPTPTTTATPTPSRVPTAADLEGDRWLQVAVLAGIGLLGTVLLLFVIGALVRFRRKRRARR
jgi:hypothetical protein